MRMIKISVISVEYLLDGAMALKQILLDNMRNN